MAGLCLAPLLSRQGHNITVIEKRSVDGSSLEEVNPINVTINASGREILKGLGILDNVKDVAVALTHRQAHHGNGEQAIQEYEPTTSGWLLSVKRSDLHALLRSNARNEGTILEYNTKLLSCRADGEALTLSTSGAFQRRYFDLIVGADGASSMVRQNLLQRQRITCALNFLPWRYANFAINAEECDKQSLNLKHLHIWSDEGVLGVGIPNCDGSISALLIFRDNSAQADVDAMHKGIKRILGRYPNLSRWLRPLLKSSSPSIGRFLEVTLDRWYVGRIVTVGDACHAMYPFCGLGLNTAFEDVVELTRALGKFSDLHVALRRYDVLRRPAAELAQTKSRLQFSFLQDLIPGSLYSVESSQGTLRSSG